MQITYMPYLAMGQVDEVALPTLGATVWNFGRMAEAFVGDAEIRDVLTRLMRTHTRAGTPISDMGVISVGVHDFRVFSEQERDACRDTRAILFLSTLAESGVSERGPNAGLYMSTAENFMLLERSFLPNAEYMAVKSGYIIEMQVGGYKIDSAAFPVAGSVPHPMFWRHDQDVQVGLLGLCRHSTLLYRRILRASEQLMEAYYNDQMVSSTTRILLLASAFEILFDLPEQGQRRKLREEFDRLFSRPDDPLRTFVTHTNRRGEQVKAQKSIKVYWANTFYELRNAIVHGDSVSTSDTIFDGVQRHLDIAVLFFVWRVKQILEEAGCLEPSLDLVRWKSPSSARLGAEPGEDGEEFFGFVYEKGDMRRKAGELIRILSISNVSNKST